MKHCLVTLFCLWALFDVSAFAQNIIRLQGAWDYALGDSTKYSD